MQQAVSKKIKAPLAFGFWLLAQPAAAWKKKISG
jgi:hypothetical protein